MALFSRRSKDRADRPNAADTARRTPAAPGVVVDETNVAASVGISMSSYGGLGTASPVAPPVRSAAPLPIVERGPAETMPGIPNNVLLRDALSRYPEAPTTRDLLDLARQVLQGHLFLRVKGDARTLIAEGKGLSFASMPIEDRRYDVAYSSGAALTASIKADGDTDTSALGQPVLRVLNHVIETEAAGLVIDPMSAPARVVLPREMIARMLSAIDQNVAIKTLLAAERTDATAAAVVDAMTRAPLWVSVNKPGEGERMGVAERHSEDGSRYIEVYSHPLEVAAMGRDGSAAPLDGGRLASALRADEGLAGVLVDPGGPWIQLSREQLAPVLALPPVNDP